MFMKKVINKWFFIFLSILFISFSVSLLFTFTIKKKNYIVKEAKILRDSIGKLNFQKDYISKAFDIGLQENGKIYLYDTIKVYELNNGKHLYPKGVKSLFTGGRKKIVIRYTEIGCNSCSDITFSLIKKYKLIDNFDILILVDFSDFEYYLKWRKISEIDYPVFWVKKGDLPFQIEQKNSSYLFTINPGNLMVNDFFIPNSLLKSYINDYLLSIASK